MNSNAAQLDAGSPRRVLGRPRREAQVDTMIAALLHGASVPDAAQAAQLGRSTAYELLQQCEVQDRLAAARADALAAATQAAVNAAKGAVETLQELANGASSEAVRVRAADALIAHASTLARDRETQAELVELHAQVARLAN